MFIIRDEINALIRISAYSLTSAALSKYSEIDSLIYSKEHKLLAITDALSKDIQQSIVDYKTGQQALLEDLEIAKGKLARAEGMLHDEIEHGKFLNTKIEATQERHVESMRTLAKALGQG